MDYTEELQAPSLEPLRFVSRRFNAEGPPLDCVEPRHAGIHLLLLRWASWARLRPKAGGSVGSVESLYRRMGGTPAATAPLGADPELLEVELALLRMPVERVTLWRRRVNGSRPRRLVVKVLEMPGATLRCLYAWRWQPVTICAALEPRLRPVAWPAHVGTMRSLLAAALAKRES